MNTREILEAAHAECFLQRKYIVKQRHTLHDPTMYREWVYAILPKLMGIINAGIDDETWGDGADKDTIGMARVIIGLDK